MNTTFKFGPPPGDPPSLQLSIAVPHLRVRQRTVEIALLKPPVGVFLTFNTCHHSRFHRSAAVAGVYAQCLCLLVLGFWCSWLLVPRAHCVLFPSFLNTSIACLHLQFLRLANRFLCQIIAVTHLITHGLVSGDTVCSGGRSPVVGLAAPGGDGGGPRRGSCASGEI